MRTYEETLKICELFYEECIKSWKRMNDPKPEAMAQLDIFRLSHDPYSPNGEKLNRKAVLDFYRKQP